MATVETPPTEVAGVAKRPRAEPPAFPGCKPVRLPRTEIDRFEGRLEYWDSATETAWICEPTTPYHERPSRLLTRLAELIGRVRGSPIESYGSMDLLLRDAGGEPRRIMQADESVYLHPAQARLPGPAAMVVGEDDFPDVVLEVDHTTDVRRGKLPLYESWGFPEVWVDVPDAPSPSRPHRRRSGLTIHVLEQGRYRVAAASRALPGWRAEEIHLALNEPTPSAQTSAVVERVAAALGARDGTGPDDDPLLRSQRRQGYERGRAEGRARPHGRPREDGPPDTAVTGHRGCGGVPRRRGGVRRRHPRRCCWRRRSPARMKRHSTISSPTSAGDDIRNRYARRRRLRSSTPVHGGRERLRSATRCATLTTRSATRLLPRRGGRGGDLATPVRHGHHVEGRSLHRRALPSRRRGTGRSASHFRVESVVGEWGARPRLLRDWPTSPGRHSCAEPAKAAAAQARVEQVAHPGHRAGRRPCSAQYTTTVRLNREARPHRQPSGAALISMYGEPLAAQHAAPTGHGCTLWLQPEPQEAAASGGSCSFGKRLNCREAPRWSSVPSGARARAAIPGWQPGPW